MPGALIRGIALIIMGEQFPGTLASAEVPGVAAFRTPTTGSPPKCSKIFLRKHFLMRKLLPQKMHFFPPVSYEASTWPARRYLSTNLPTHSLPQLIPPGRHALVPTHATCCCHCPSSKSGCSCHWSCSCPIRAGTTPPGCSPEPGHTTDEPLADTDPHAPLTL